MGDRLLSEYALSLRLILILNELLLVFLINVVWLISPRKERIHLWYKQKAARYTRRAALQIFLQTLVTH